MNSRLLSCRVRHERTWPKAHRFEYPLYTYLLDVDELDELDRKLRLFGHNRVRLASVHDADYLEDGPGTVRDKLSRLLKPQGMALTAHDTVLVATSARFLNYVFNPVSFYWIFRDGKHLGCVAEVNNTFGEKHVYPLPGAGDTAGFPARYRADKAFHVSPFFDRSGEYRFRFGDVRHGLDVTVSLYREGEKVFEASLVEEGERQTISDAVLARTALTRPFTVHLTFPRILWEAGKIHFGKKAAYHPKPAPDSPMTIRSKSAKSIKESICRHFVFRHLRGMERGSLSISLPDGSQKRFGGERPGSEASMRIHSDAFFPMAALHGDIGLGEAYSDGLWDSPDLVALFRFFLENRQVHVPPGNFLKRFALDSCGLFQRCCHQKAPKNDEAGSRTNISAHYDLSNELFSHFLDPTMTYSSGIYRNPCDPDEDLEQAQLRKNRVLADKACIGPDDHVLEVGCGWGGFAEQTARERGCRVTGVTVSREQYDYARERIRRAGLEDRVEIRFQDYRKLNERFDRIVSIEMLEAVGHRYHGEYFRTLERLLTPSGVAVIQVITIQDPHYDRYRRSMDWIRKHIFPGGALPSLTRICATATRHTALTVQNVDAVGLHYANTLRQWRRNFNENWESIAPLGFDEYFRRTWNYYLGVCEAGFIHGHINDLQIVLSRAEPAATAHCCGIVEKPPQNTE